MVAEVLELLRPVPAGVVVDATVGAGGHSAAILAAMPSVAVLAIDRDAEAVRESAARLARFGGRARVMHGRFDALTEIAAAEVPAWHAAPTTGTAPVVGVLFDLGVSSGQLDEPGRGFTFRSDAPLDMRMDRSEGRTAADVVNTLGEYELARLFAANGEGRNGRRIAHEIVTRRPLHTTGELARVVESATPAAARRRGHPAKRVFQAIRLEVNEELTMLSPAIDEALSLLAPGGRCVVLSYHSGEDRLVKERFATAASGGCKCPPELGCVCGARPTVRILTRGARSPSAAETSENPRSRSARLRAAEKLTDSPGAASDPVDPFAGPTGRAA
jgi:16S rRNA (cytosine1402-N4)-methyltransferase